MTELRLVLLLEYVYGFWEGESCGPFRDVTELRLVLPLEYVYGFWEGES